MIEPIITTDHIKDALAEGKGKVVKLSDRDGKVFYVLGVYHSDLPQDVTKPLPALPLSEREQFLETCLSAANRNREHPLAKAVALLNRLDGVFRRPNESTPDVKPAIDLLNGYAASCSPDHANLTAKAIDRIQRSVKSIEEKKLSIKRQHQNPMAAR